MKGFSQLRGGYVGQNVIAVKKYSVLRDGGSHAHEVLNGESCGYCQVIQDFGIYSEKQGTRGKWFGMPHPPNHTCDKFEQLDESDIQFV